MSWLLFYGRKISESINVSVVRHDASMKKAFVFCTVSADVRVSALMASDRSPERLCQKFSLRLIEKYEINR